MYISKLTDFLTLRSEKIIALALLIGFVSIFCWCGFNSVDFGVHWDELKLINSVANTAKNGIILPGWYNYPSLSYLISFITALAGFLIEIITNPLVNLPAVDKDGIVVISRLFSDFINTETYHFELRKVFILLTAASSIFVAISLRIIGTDWIASAIGGVSILLFYQIFYHSRWIAPDTLLMLASSLVIMTSIWAVKYASFRGLFFAAICAGLATAAKYPGGIMLFLPLYAATKGANKSRRIGIVTALFFLTFIFITPGALLEPVQFIKDVRGEINHYKAGHGAHTNDSKWDGIQKTSEFLLFRFFSPNASMSLFVILLAALGAIFIWRKNKNYAYILLFPAITYFIYFSTQKVLLVRNLLMLGPFISVLIGIAIDSLMTQCKKSIIRFAIPLFILILLALNLRYYFYAVDSLNNPEYNSWGNLLKDYLDKNNDKKISLSEKVLKFLPETYGASHPPFYPRESADVYIFSLKEEEWICANRRNSFQVIAGPRDTDLDYYPEWVGKDRIVVLDQHICH